MVPDFQITGTAAATPCAECGDEGLADAGEVHDSSERAF
jgi:hypothetical protein